MSEASDQITEYLSVGGLFNPEIMNQTQHEAVRDTLIKARDDIQSLERENAALRADKERLDWLSQTKCAYYYEGQCCWRINEDKNTDGDTLRAAIDTARKEAQPLNHII